MRNLRNLYRILHVQHDAPTAVIKGSYRTLMQTLRHHPDLGGDEWNARLLNEAMETLCDPVARARYDATLDGTADGRDRDAGSRGRASSSTAAAAAADSARPASPARPSSRLAPPSSSCPFCGAAVFTVTTVAVGAYPDARTCTRCGGPTRSPDAASAAVSSGSERRRTFRLVRDTDASLRRRPADGERLAVTLLEFSAAGGALESPVALEVGEIVLLDASVLAAIATVRSSRAGGPGARRRIGLEFLTLELRGSPGDVLSVDV